MNFSGNVALVGGKWIPQLCCVMGLREGNEFFLAHFSVHSDWLEHHMHII
jgi:hypothetical protein